LKKYDITLKECHNFPPVKFFYTGETIAHQRSILKINKKIKTVKVHVKNLNSPLFPNI